MIPPGTIVITRSIVDGLNVGQLIEHTADYVVLKNAFRLLYSRPKKGTGYEGIAAYGVADEARRSTIAREKTINEPHAIIRCSKEAIPSLKALASPARLLG